MFIVSSLLAGGAQPNKYSKSKQRCSKNKVVFRGGHVLVRSIVFQRTEKGPGYRLQRFHGAKQRMEMALWWLLVVSTEKG